MKNNKEHNEKWPFIPDHPYAFIECSNRMDDVYQNIDDYNRQLMKR